MLRLRQRATPPLLRLLMRKVDLFLHHGRQRESGAPLSVMTTASHDAFTMNGLLRTVFADGGFSSKLLGRDRLISLGRLQSQHAASFAFVELRLTQARLRRALGPSTLFVPWFVEAVVDVSPESSRRWGHNVRRWLRSTERAGFTYSVSREHEHFKTFVEEYWRPLMRRRFGRATIDTGYDKLTRPNTPPDVLQNLEIVRVFRGDRWVAGMLVRTRPGGIPEALEMGVLGGDASLVDAGAQFAVYNAVFAETRNRGFDKVSLMWCFPDLASGSLRHKLQFRPSIRFAKYPFGVALVPGEATPAATSFLVNHPLLHAEDGCLKPVFFADAEGAIARPDLLKEGRLNGVAAPSITPASEVWNRAT